MAREPDHRPVRDGFALARVRFVRAQRHRAHALERALVDGRALPDCSLALGRFTLFKAMATEKDTAAQSLAHKR